MDKEQIYFELSNKVEKVESIMELYDTPHPGINKNENDKLITSNYSTFKSHVELALSDLQNRERRKNLTEDELAFYLPAINEAVLACKQAKNSVQVDKIFSCLYDASLSLGHYRSQLGV